MATPLPPLRRRESADGRQLSHHLNQPVEKDLQMLKDLGFDPDWDEHDFAGQQELAPSVRKAD